MADMDVLDAAALAWAQFWQVTLVAGVVAVTVRLLARNRPHLAHVLWLLVILKCITPPLWSSPGGVFCWLQPQSVTADTGVAALSAAPQQIEAGGHAASGDADVVVYAPPRPGNLASVAVVHDGGVETSEEQPARVFPRDWRSGSLAALAALWLLGVTVVIAAGACRWLACWKLLRNAGRVEHPQLERMIVRLVKQLGLRRRVRLLVTKSRVGPAVIGVLRPMVVLPLAVVEGKSPAELEPIIAHELSHIRRGDLWISLLQALAQTVWWFHPLIWLASRLITREAERCCDEQVLAELGCSPAIYARSLLDVLDRKRTLLAVPTFPGVRPVEVTSKRLERIMQLGQGCRKRTPWWCWLLLAALAAAALPGAAFQAAAEEKAILGGKTNDSRSGQGARVDSPSYVVVYKVEDLLKRIERECRVDRVRAAELLVEWIGRPLTRSDGEAKADMDLALQASSVVARATARRHQEIVECLAHARKHGFHEIRIETRIASGSEALVNELLGGWEVLPASEGDARDGVGTTKVDENGETYLLEAEIESERKTSRTENYGRARHTIQRRFPVTAKVLDDEQVRAMIHRLKRDGRSNLIFAPKVTLFHGQTARIVDAVQRPFVVGAARNERGEVKPQIRVITEGLTLRLNSKIQGNDKVRLDCGVEFSDVLSVETVNIRRKAGQEPLTLQVPEINSMKMDVLTELESGKTLALGGLKKKREADGKVESLLVLIRARIVPVLHDEVEGEDDEPSQARLKADSDAYYGTRDLWMEDERKHVRPERHVDKDMVTKTYAVADLVLPFPPIPTEAEPATAKGESPAGLDRAEFDSLIALIQSTVQPDTWTKAGGGGTIAAFETNLSLVIRQTRNAHNDIFELLEELRILQDVQVTLEIEAVRVPTEAAGDVSRHLQLISTQQLAEFRRHGGKSSADALKLMIGKGRDGSALTASRLKVTLFNGQGTELPFTTEEDGRDDTIRLQVRPSVVDDLSRLQLQVTVNADDALSALANAESIVVPDGGSVVFDAREELLTRRGVPAGLVHVPVVKDLLARSMRSRGDERLLLVITPRIVVPEEEEEPIGRPLK